MRTDIRTIIILALLWAHAPASRATPRPALNFEKNFGGTGTDVATAVAVDRSGNTYVAGTTTSLDFPVSNAFKPHLGGAALRMSADQGASWLAPAVPGPVYAVAGSSKQPNIVFAGTANGILKSTDGGKTWTALPSAPRFLVNALVVDSVNPDIIYAGTNAGTFKSPDGGMSWLSIDQSQGVIILISGPAGSSTLFKVVDVYNRSPGVYRTTDGGANWSLLANSPPGVFSLACDPLNADVLYAAADKYGSDGGGDQAIYKTTDAGETWTKLALVPVSVSTFALAISTTTVYVGTDNGVLLSRDAGATWVRTSVTAAADNIAVDPTNPRTVYAASVRGIFRSIDGGTIWSASLAVRQDVQTLAVIPTNPPAVFVGSTPGQNVFVTKWSADGKQMLYSTYVGGSYYDFATGISVDNQGNAYVTGYSFSLDFPVTPGALQTRNSGSSNAFLAKIGPQGDKLLYSTYLGGSAEDAASAIALDNAGNVYLTGYAGSSDFPVTAGAQQNFLREKCPTPPAPGWPSRVNLGDAFVVKIHTDTSQLVYSTFLGGTCGEQGLGIAVDSSGNAILVGVTDSPDFPVTASALQPRYIGGAFSGFLAKLTPQGSLAYATFLGGTGDDTAEAVAVDSQGGVYVTGSTFGFDAIQFGAPGQFFITDPVYGSPFYYSTIYLRGPVAPFPVGFPYQTTGAAYVLKLNSTAWTRSYLKYVGANYGEAKTVAVDPIGRVWITGTSDTLNSSPKSPPFPTVHPFQAKIGPDFITQLSADGSELLFSSLVDSANALALDASGNAFIAGSNADFAFSDLFLGLDQMKAGLIRIDVDVPSSITVEEPHRLIPTMGSTYPFDGIAPGELIVLTGIGLGPDQEAPAQLTPDGKLATTLAGTTVTFDNVPASLLSVQSERIVCIAPFGLGGNNSLPSIMQVQNNNILANSIRLGIVRTAVSIVAVVNPDGSINSTDHPAAPDSIVTIYAAGLGQTIPASVDGEISGSSQQLQYNAAPTYGPINVNIGGTQAEIVYLGAAPGQVSAITQINVRIPAQLIPGNYTLNLALGDPLFQNSSSVSLNVGP